MTLPFTFRSEVVPADAQAVEQLVRATGFFNAEETAIAVELVTERLAKGPASGYWFVMAEEGAKLAGYACYGPIGGTACSHDLFWIVVDPAIQRRGLGRQLVARAEEAIRAMGGCRVYIETSTRGQYQPTRGFYDQAGYRLEAVLEDFYGPGDGKAVYVKVVG